MGGQYDLGMQYYREGKYKSAQDVFHQLVEEFEEDHKSWNALGVTCSQLGDNDTAEVCFNNALFLSPDTERYAKNKRALLSKKNKSIEISKPASLTKANILPLMGFIGPKNVGRFFILLIVILLIFIGGLHFLSNSALNAASNQVSQTIPSVSGQIQTSSSNSNGGGILDQVQDAQVKTSEDSSVNLMESASDMLSQRSTNTPNFNPLSHSYEVEIKDNTIYFTCTGVNDMPKRIIDFSVIWPDESQETINNEVGKVIQHSAIGNSSIVITARFEDESKTILLSRDV